MSKFIPPFNFNKWIEEHKHLLKPPVGAKLVFEHANFIIMVVGGPNKRSDYHVNMGEEFYYQLHGDMVLKIVRDGKFEDLPINEGDIFLLPSNMPHSPQRFENTVGLVIEQKRATPGIFKSIEREVIFKLRWYCENDACRTVDNIVYEESFHLDTLDLGVALKPVIERYYASEALRTCKKCGFINPVPKPNIKIDD